MNINWHPDEPYDPFEVASHPEKYSTSLFSFDDYLTTIVLFLENEWKKQDYDISDLYEKVEAGKTELEGELDYAKYQMESFPEFENTIFSSFFVMIYFHLESELMRYCRDLEKRSPERVQWSDLAGNNVVDKAMTYLIKVQQIEFSRGESPEWDGVQNFKYLRNCIVHNQGRVDDFFEKSQREKLLKFIQRKNSKITLEDTKCILDKNFCSDALVIIKKFLHSVAAAKKTKVL